MDKQIAPQRRRHKVSLLPGKTLPGPPGKTVIIRPRRFDGETAGHWSLLGLFVLACLYTLAVAQSFLLPLVTAALLALILNPLSHHLRSLGLPRIAAAGFLVLGIVGLAIFGAVWLTPSFNDWSARAPEIIREIEEKFRPVKESLEAVEKATQSVEAATTVGEGEEEVLQTVVVKGPGVLSSIALVAPTIAFQLSLTIALTFFFLLDGHAIRSRLITAPRTFGGRLRTARICFDIQRHVATYLLSVSAINLALGIAAGLVAYAVGLPNPFLWGTGMAILNFIPFLGPAIMIAIVFAVGLVSFPTLGMALLAPLGFFVLNVVESQIVTPLVLGRRLLTSPLAIFSAVAFGGWLWGVVGALIAVPLLILGITVARHLTGAPRLSP